MLALILVLGLFPGLIFKITDGSVQNLVSHVSQSLGR